MSAESLGSADQLLTAQFLKTGETPLHPDEYYKVPTASREIAVNIGGTTLRLVRDRKFNGTRLYLPYDGYYSTRGAKREERPRTLNTTYDDATKTDRILLGPDHQGKHLFPTAQRGTVAEIVLQQRQPGAAPIFYVRAANGEDRVSTQVEPSYEEQIRAAIEEQGLVTPGPNERKTLDRPEQTVAADLRSGLMIDFDPETARGSYGQYSRESLMASGNILYARRGGGTGDFFTLEPYLPVEVGTDYQPNLGGQNPGQLPSLEPRDMRVVMVPAAPGSQESSRLLITNHGKSTGIDASGVK